MKLLATVSITILVSSIALSASPVPQQRSVSIGDPAEPDPFFTPEDPAPAPAPSIDPAAIEPGLSKPPAKSARSFSPEQLIGKPDTPNAGDYPTCWAASTRDGGKEWLELHYGGQVQPLAVWVYENYAPGALFQVTGLVDGVEIQLWRGIDPTPRTAPKGISKILVDTEHKLDAIRVYLDCKAVNGWNEIDAVAILDQDENLRWAVNAKSTTSYGGTEPIAFVDPFQPPREVFEEKFADAEARIQQNAQAIATLERELDARRANLRTLQAELKALRRDYRKLQETEPPNRKPAGDE